MGASMLVDSDAMDALCKRILDLETKVNPEFAELFFSQDDIHPNDGGGVAPDAQPASFLSNTVEGGWSVAANTASYSGSVKVIKGNINLLALDTGTSNYWSKPIIRVTENVSGRVFYLEELAMQDNSAYDGSVYFDGSFVHLNPPINPNYVIEYFSKENRTATLTPQPNSSLVFEANCLNN